METKKLIRLSLSEEAFWIVNKVMARNIGIEETVFLSDLISKEKYFEDRNQLDNCGGFFNTAENLQDDLGIKEGAKKRLQNRLIKLGIVKIKKRGVPAKNYWYLNHEKILSIMTDSSQAENHLTCQEENDLSCEVENNPSGEIENHLTINKNKEIIINNENKEENIEPDKPVSLRTRVTLLFDEYYESIYNEKFSWGSKQKSARYGREVSEIIANAGNYDDEEILQKIESKMLILRWFGETKNQDFWKFNYANLANKWNELTVPFDPDIDKYKKLIVQWNKLTGQIIDLTPGLVSMFSVAKCRHNLTVVQKAVLAKAVNEFDIKNNTRNLPILIADKNGQLLTYSGKYDGENMRGLIEKKLNSNHEDHNPFPEISYKSDITELLAYDWMQHGIDSLSRYVIGRDGYNEIKNGGDIKKIIEKIYDQKLTEYMKGGVIKK